MSEVRLNLGCQVHYFDGWTNIDVVSDDPNLKVDLYADVSDLSNLYEDNSVDFIYAGHLVEHFYPDTLPLVIKEWHRILKPNGILAVVTPDSGAVMRDYAAGRFQIDSTWQQLYGRIYSYDRPEERHHIAFDYPLLARTMSCVPWIKMTQFDFGIPPQELLPFMDTHISRGAYQIGTVCQK